MERKTLYTYIIPICTVILLISISWWGYSQLNSQEQKTDINLYTLIPNDSEALLETNDINSLYKNINNSHYVQKYNLLDVSSLLTLLTNHIDDIAKQQAHGISSKMNRQLLVSFHQPGTKHDQVIYGRFVKDDINSIIKLIQQSKGYTHTPKKLIYKGEEITIFPLGKEFLACYIKPGFYAASLQVKLIEKVIDTYLTGESINQNNSFNTLRKQTKHNEQLSLYINKGKDCNTWEHLEIRMNASAIYLTNNLSNKTPQKTYQAPLLDRVETTYLPQHIQLVAQLPLKNPNIKNDNQSSANPSALEKILYDNGCHEIDLILFSQPTAEDSIYNQTQVIMVSPTPISQTENIKSQLSSFMKAKRHPSLWLQNTPYPIWHYKADTILNHKLLPQHTGDEIWLSFYQNNLLMSSNKNTLINYIKEFVNKQKNSPTYKANKIVYQHCLADLAEQANFTLVADLNTLINNQTIHTKNTHLIPSFFFKHKDFFKHFMLATQFIHDDEHTSSQMILTYQGDSILFKQTKD